MATYNIASMDIQDNGDTYHLISGVPFGVCTTAAATVAKVVTTFPEITEMRQGTSVKVQFEKDNTAASPTLNVCSLGAKKIAGANSDGVKWAAGSVVTFTYDGVSQWLMNDATPIDRITESEIQSIFATL